MQHTQFVSFYQVDSPRQQPAVWARVGPASWSQSHQNWGAAGRRGLRKSTFEPQPALCRSCDPGTAFLDRIALASSASLYVSQLIAGVEFGCVCFAPRFRKVGYTSKLLS